jgi:hypothetical protein
MKGGNKMDKIIGYKGFNKNMTCRNFQYQIGKEYKTDGKVAICQHGFHACQHPLDAFTFYPPSSSVYCKVEQGGTLKRDTDPKYDTKIASSEIKIMKEFSIDELILATFDNVKGGCRSKPNRNKDNAFIKRDHPCAAIKVGVGSMVEGAPGVAISGGVKSAVEAMHKTAVRVNDRSAVVVGNSSAVNVGNWSAVKSNYGSAIVGQGEVMVKTGFTSAVKVRDGSVIDTGNESAVVGGNDLDIYTDGDSAIKAGARADIKTLHESAVIAGYDSIVSVGHSSVVMGDSDSKLIGGEYSVVYGRGTAQVCGGMGAILVLVKLDDNGVPIKVITKVVDGKKIKTNTFYKLEKGEFVEVINGEEE